MSEGICQDVINMAKTAEFVGCSSFVWDWSYVAC